MDSFWFAQAVIDILLTLNDYKHHTIQRYSVMWHANENSKAYHCAFDRIDLKIIIHIIFPQRLFGQETVVFKHKPYVWETSDSFLELNKLPKLSLNLNHFLNTCLLCGWHVKQNWLSYKNFRCDEMEVTCAGLCWNWNLFIVPFTRM